MTEHVFDSFFHILDQIEMPSARKGGKKGSAKGTSVAPPPAAAAAVIKKDGEQPKVSERTCTGQLVSRPLSKDIKFETFSLSYFGEDLIKVCA